MTTESDILLKHCKEAFKNSSNLVPTIETEIFPMQSLTSKQFQQCLFILDVNLGKSYLKMNGVEWKVQKLQEMKEDGLVYVLLHDKTVNSDKPLGFLSMKIINEDDFDVLYLYEIQLLPNYCKRGLGTQLMATIHILPSLINSDKAFTNSHSKLSGTALTVFSSNGPARHLYAKFHYKVNKFSPTEREIRGGKIIEPEYFILERAAE